MKKLITSIAIIAALNTAIIAQTSESFGGLGISVYPGKKGASIAECESYNGPSLISPLYSLIYKRQEEK